jgi:hypothetical protein
VVTKKKLASAPMLTERVGRPKQKGRNATIAAFTDYAACSYCGGACFVMSSRPVGWAGRAGGVRNAGGFTKSKNSVMSSAAASRAVSGGRLKRVSTSLRIEISSRLV